MRKDKEQANILRKSGLSYSEIISKMSVPRSTLSSWFKDQEWSNNVARENLMTANKGAGIKMVVLNTIRGNRLRAVYNDAKQDAFLDFNELKQNSLFLSGIILYWCHGDKSSKHKVSFSSSNYSKIKLFKQFIENVCEIKHYKVILMINNGQNEEFCKNYWIDKCGFEIFQFNKVSVIKGKDGKITSKIKHGYGICNIVLTSAYLKSKFIKWIELIEKGE